MEIRYTSPLQDCSWYLSVMWRTILLVGLAVVFLQPSRILAATADWLFNVTVPVVDRSFAARHEGGQLALQILIKRLTGMKDIPPGVVIDSALKNPESYIVRYAYDSRKSEDIETRVLSFGFDPLGVRKLLRAAGLPRWSSNRPNIVAWIVVESEGTRELLAAQSQHPLVLALKSEAEERGLPLTLPLMDLEDQLKVTDGVVWGGLTQVLLPAAERYQADAVLIGRLSESLDGWAARWDYYESPGFSGSSRGLDRRLELSSLLAEDAAIAIVDFVTADLVGRYAVAGSETHQLWFRIQGIRDINAYAAVMRYFEQLEYLDNVQLSGMQGDVLVLSLTTQSPWLQLKKLLALDGNVTFVEPQLTDVMGPDHDSAQVKQFLWQPHAVRG